MATGKSDQKTLDLVDDWSDGLTTIKNFVRVYREYCRSMKIERLGDVQQLANGAREFLRGRALAASASFELAVLKVNFIRLAFEKSFLAASVYLRDEACVETFKRQPSMDPDEQTHLDVWLRGLLVQVVPEWLRASKLDDDFDHTVAKWSDDISDAAKVLMDTLGASTEEDGFCVKAFLEDVESLRVVFAVATHGASIATQCDAEGARAALERLRSGRTLKQHFSKALTCPAGKEVVFRVCMFLQHSAQDEIADSKLACAIKALKDERLLSVEDDPDTPELSVIANFDSIPILIETIEENMSDIVEAKLLWTAMGSARGAPSIREWLELATRKLVIWDQSASLKMYCSLRPVLDAALEEEEKTRPIDALEASEGAMGTWEDELMVPTRLFEQLANFVDSVQAVLNDDALVKDVRGVVAEIEQHVQTRMLVLSFHKAVLNFPEDELPTEPAVAVRQWLDALGGHGSDNPGLLGAALRLRNIVKDQLKSGSLGFDSGRFKPTQVLICRDVDAACVEQRIQWADVASFPPLLAQLDVCEQAGVFVNRCFYVIFDALCETLNIDAIVVDAIVVDELAALVAPRAAASTEAAGTLEQWSLECADRISSLVHIDQLRAGACDEALEGPARTQPSRSRSLLRLFADLALGTETMDAGALVRGSRREVQTSHVVEMCQALACVQSLTSALGAIHLACQQGTVFNHRRLDERIVALVAYMISAQRPRWETLLTPGSSQTPWAVPVAALGRWFDRLDAVVPQIKRRLMRILAQEGSKEVNIEVDALPKYQHFLNDTVFNTRLCLRHLLVPEVKRKIQQALANIHSMQRHIKNVHDQWQMLPGLRRDEEFSQGISFMEEGYACAKCTAGVVAAASIALEMKGSEQSATAQAFLSTRRGMLPKALAAALEGLGSGSTSRTHAALVKRARRVKPHVPQSAAADEGDSD